MMNLEILDHVLLLLLLPLLLLFLSCFASPHQGSNLQEQDSLLSLRKIQCNKFISFLEYWSSSVECCL